MINVIGDIVGSSGYANHTRALTNALTRVTDVRLTTQLPPGSEGQISDKELLLIKKKPELKETNLIITYPMAWRLNLGSGINIVYLVWEGSKIPKAFIPELANPDIHHIIVPSDHTLRAVQKGLIGDTRCSEILTKLRLIPHGVNHDQFYPIDSRLTEDLVFLANKGWRNMEDRGGVQYLLKAYYEEFTKEDKVKLILKINPAYGIENLQALMSQILVPRENAPQILVNTQNFKDGDVVKVYHQADVFISTTRAEAFNLPCLEAMACGLPVITTNYGGQTDYVDDKTGWLLKKGTIVPVEHELMYEGVDWLTPDIGEIKALLRHIYNNQQEISIKSSLSLAKAKEYSWDNTARSIFNLLPKDL